jgi:two-component system, chemotaxis family, CheB/CheR fusion protein
MEDSTITASPATDPPKKTKPTVVAVGSSAGGLEALRALLHRLPRNRDFSYVIAQHLSPTHLSMLTTLLSRETSLTVNQVEDGMIIEPATIYVTPPNADVVYQGGQFRLQPPSERGPKPSIDTLLFSLAKANAERTIAVILSGSGSDGSIGARQLKNAGGYLIVQEPKSAKYPSMPQAALATGMADAILAPEDIGPHLERLSSSAPPAKPVRLSRRQNEVDQVLERINVCAGIDFRGYKTNTIYRRIQQRITATRSSGMAGYIQLLDENHEEIQSLAQNCLISVTSFFRDASAFEELGSLLAKRIPAESPEPVRAWTAGCATGEEAYTLAMVLANLFPKRRIQIFATDLDDSAISFARKAVYAAPSVRDLPPGLLNKHFTESVQGYTVDRATRERVVFARHDIVRDPLFLNLDLISCRNVLIYFKPPLQEEIFLKFHHALKPGGVLFLGRSENAVGDYFDLEDRKNRIFVNRPLRDNERHLPVVREWQGFERGGDSPSAQAAPAASGLRAALVDHFSPKAVLVDETFRILETHGDLNGLLSIPAGRANFTLLNLLPKALAVVVRGLLQRALHADANPPQAINRTYSFGRKRTRVELSVIPLETGGRPRLLMVAFRDLPGRPSTAEIAESAPNHSDAQFQDLERELQSTRECLQATVEELETSNEELQALNEEMQASNEELQASNEELHASNEELQSTNEELLTVNEEIEHKSIELAFLIEDLENIQNSLDGPLLVADARGYLRHVNEEARRLFGLTGDHLGGPVLLPNDASLATQLASRLHKVIETGETLEFKSVSLSRHYRILVRPYVGRHKANRGAVVVLHDITQIVGVNDRLRRSEHRVRLSGARHEATLNSLPANIAVLDARGTILAVNSAWKRFAMDNGYMEKRHGVGKNYLAVCEKAGDVHALAIAEGVRAVLAGDAGDFAHEYPCHSPVERRWFRCLVSPVSDEGAVVMHFNITAQKLREERDAFRIGALEAAPYPAFSADPQGVIDWGNAAFLHLLGMESSQVAGRHASLLEVPGNAHGFSWLFQRARATRETASAELRLAAKGDEARILRFSVTALHYPSSGELRFAAAGEDLTEQLQSEARMIYTTEHDELTALLNRKSILARLERAIDRQRERGGRVALLFLDLDRFKDTNDTLGHLVGDQILIEAANRLRANVPDTCNLARFGGDEFVVFVENPGSEEDLELLVERLLLAFSKPVVVDGRHLQATASMGIAFFPQDAATAEELVSRADLAMYRAKADGRRAYRRFDQQIQREIQERLLIERDLSRAITHKDLWVAFQPQIDLRSRRVVGAEALLRWNHPDAQAIPISKVISIAEESGLILPIGQWVIREAVQQLARWRSIDPSLRLSVNLSAVQFNQQDVFAQIMEQLQFFAIPATKLKVEITESVLLNRSSRVRETLHALHGAGIGLHLDDFGTGYSSLTYLQQFPIEAVKIDSSFLLGVGRDRQDEAIVDAIVKLAQSLHIDAVAEGVENEAQLSFLEQSGCQIAQGYHWAKPLAADDFTDFLASRQNPPEMNFAARA